jgi:enoyl-CoA hydratase/carnithine racemase
MSEPILYANVGSVAIITLNRPERLNAMDKVMLDQLTAAADKAEQDSQIRAVVLTGAGSGFSSGFDLKDQAIATPSGIEEWRRVLRRDFNACMKFWHLSKPTVAAVHGPAIAGACELSMACDVTIASEDAIFGEPELRFGAGIVVMLLPWLVGVKRAKEIILLGMDRIDAIEAANIGLINRVVPKGDHLKEGIRMAQQLARIDCALMTETKRAINRQFAIMGLNEALEEALEIDTEIEGLGMPTKVKFLEITRERGLRAALDWRDQIR